MMPAVQAGLEWSFINWRLPSLVFDEGLDSVEAFYAALSKQYGFTVLPPESELGPLAKRDLGRNARDAVRDYRRWTEFYPQSIDAGAGLADSLTAIGDNKAAMAALDEAIRLADQQKDSRAAELRLRRAKLGTNSVAH